jgi:hypothetical protein
MKRLRAKLTYANVVATLALFLVIAGGSAFAASRLAKGSVGTKQVKNKAITAAKIKPGAVTGAKLAAGAVGTASIANGAVTGDKVNLGTLGTVPRAGFASSAGDAATLQGNPAGAFVRGPGQIFGNSVNLNLGDSRVPVLNVPGFGALTAGCEPGPGAAHKPAGAFEFVNGSGATLATTLLYQGGFTDGGILAAGETNKLNGIEVLATWILSFASLSGPPKVLTLYLDFDGNNTPTDCVMFAQATVTGA